MPSIDLRTRAAPKMPSVSGGERGSIGEKVTHDPMQSEKPDSGVARNWIVPRFGRLP
jgi:hypothetical protein